MLKTYSVILERSTIYTTEVEVEAESKMEAEEKAIEQSYGMEWVEVYDEDIEVFDVECLSPNDDGDVDDEDDDFERDVDA